MRRPPARRRHQRCAGAGAPQAAALPAVSARVPTRGHGAPGACRASTTSCLLTPEDDVYPQQACLPGRVPGPAHLSSQAAQRTAVGLQHERARAPTCGRRRAPQQEVLCRAGSSMTLACMCRAVPRGQRLQRSWRCMCSVQSRGYIMATPAHHGVRPSRYPHNAVGGGILLHFQVAAREHLAANTGSRATCVPGHPLLSARSELELLPSSAAASVAAAFLKRRKDECGGGEAQVCTHAAHEPLYKHKLHYNLLLQQ